MHQFGNHLLISHIGNGLCYLPTSIDSLWSPWFPDVRVFGGGIRDTSTPFLTAPLNLVAIAPVILALLLYFEQQRKALLLGLVGALVLGVTIYVLIPPLENSTLETPCSHDVSVGYGHLLIDSLSRIQFAYRLVNGFTFQLAGLFVISLTGVYLARQNSSSTGREAERERLPSNRFRSLLIVATLVTMAAISIKTIEVCIEFIGFPPVGNTKYRRAIASPEHYPSTYYSSTDYSMPGASPHIGVGLENVEKHSIVLLPVWRRKEPVTVNCQAACLVSTNILPSSLWEYYDNGQPLDSSRIYIDYNKVALQLDAGTHALRMRHGGVLVYVFHLIRPLWILWFFVSAFWFVRTSYRTLLLDGAPSTWERTEP